MADPREVFDTGLNPAEIDPLRPRPIDTPWGSFAIFSSGGKLRAVQSFCPHLMGPLFQGSVVGETVTCPWHQWRFSLVSGRRLDVAGRVLARDERLETLEVEIGPFGTILLRHRERSAGRDA